MCTYICHFTRGRRTIFAPSLYSSAEGVQLTSAFFPYSMFYSRTVSLDRCWGKVPASGRHCRKGLMAQTGKERWFCQVHLKIYLSSSAFCENRVCASCCIPSRLLWGVPCPSAVRSYDLLDAQQPLYTSSLGLDIHHELVWYSKGYSLKLWSRHLQLNALPHRLTPVAALL